MWRSQTPCPHFCTACSAERQPPPPALTQACLARVRSSSDARYAVPAIGGVDPRRAEELLQHVRLMGHALSMTTCSMSDCMTHLLAGPYVSFMNSH